MELQTSRDAGAEDASDGPSGIEHGRDRLGLNGDARLHARDGCSREGAWGDSMWDRGERL